MKVSIGDQHLEVELPAGLREADLTDRDAQRVEAADALLDVVGRVARDGEVVALAENCPSGAIRYEYEDGRPGEAPARVNVARVREDGPVAIVGELRISGAGARRATLCRCGDSKNKPYCDGSHTAAGFKASGERAPKDVTPLAVRNGPVNIRRIRDGPLEVSGNLEICTGTGHTISRGTKAWLCRCGKSKDKPYCDGSHNGAGFAAEGD